MCGSIVNTMVLQPTKLNKTGQNTIWYFASRLTMAFSGPLEWFSVSNHLQIKKENFVNFRLQNIQTSFEKRSPYTALYTVPCQASVNIPLFLFLTLLLVLTYLKLIEKYSFFRFQVPWCSPRVPLASCLCTNRTRRLGHDLQKRKLVFVLEYKSRSLIISFTKT